MTVQDQRLDHFADEMVAFDHPESACAVGFGGATLAVDSGIDVTARVLLEEFAECAIREIDARSRRSCGAAVPVCGVL